jgi:outer membrane protein assembly factor BamB
MLALSADRETKHSGIVWASVPINGDGNHAVVEGILRAYDPTEFLMEPDSSEPTIKLLWDSKAIPGDTFHYDKFCPPVVANGKVYVTSYEGCVDVYGPGKP